MGFLSSKKSKLSEVTSFGSKSSSQISGVDGVIVTARRVEPQPDDQKPSASFDVHKSAAPRVGEESLRTIPSTKFEAPSFDLPPTPMRSSTQVKEAEVFQECLDVPVDEEENYQWLMGPVAGAFLGNAMLIGVAFLLAVVWNMFEEFREPLLWGIWCSIALRSVKEWLVGALEGHLRKRSLLSLSILPLEMVFGIFCDAWDSIILGGRIWNQKLAYKTEERKALLRKLDKAESGKDTKPPSKAKIFLKTAKDFCVWSAGCSMLALDAVNDVLKSKQAAHKALAESVRPSATTLLFKRLLGACLLFECFRWADALVGMWSLFVATFAASVLAFSYAALCVVQSFRGMEPIPLSARLKAEAVASQDLILRIFGIAKAIVMGVWNGLGRMTESMDRKVRESILASLDNIVAGLLCLLLLVGTFSTILFFSVQIGGEMHGAVNAAINVKMDVGVNVTKGGLVSYVPEWALEQVEDGRAQALALAQENMPKIVQGIEEKVHELVEQYNLTETASELYIMYATLQHVPCDPDEEHLFAIDSAKANAEQRSAALNLAQADQDMQKAELQLNKAVQSWTLLLNGTAELPSSARGICEVAEAPGRRQQAECHNAESKSANQVEAEAEQQVVQADALLKAATMSVQQAQIAFGDAEAAAALAGKKLNRCYITRGEGNGKDALVSTELLARFKTILELLLRMQVSEAVEEFKNASIDIMKRVEKRDLTDGYDADKLKDLADVGQGLVEPLVDVAKSLAGALLASLGSSTSALMSGGTSIINSILGALQASLSFVSFVALLYFLLSQDEDIIDTTLNSLPIAPSSRQNVEKSVRSALSGVFEVTIKLALFHGIYTWLTLRMVGVHFVYLPTLLALVLSCFPLIPITVVLVPAILELVFCGAWLRLAILLLTHVVGGSADDTIVQSVPGHSQWLTGMAIAGGMATFDNAFKGALLGPLLVAVLIMLQNLASIFSSSNSRHK